MILVKNVEVSKIANDVYVTDFAPEILMQEGIGSPIPDTKISSEVVVGRLFMNADGKRIIIGMTKKVQDAIGLPFEAFESQTNTIAHLTTAYSREMKHVEYLSSKVRILESMTFWGWVKMAWRRRGNATK